MDWKSRLIAWFTIKRVVIIFCVLLGISALEKITQKEQKAPVVVSVPAKPDTSWLEEGDPFGAFYYSKEYVKLRLKAPSTAKFPESERDNTSISREGQVYTVVSWVDSQNSFGAMLRTVYACRIEQVKEGVWQLRELSFFK